MPKIIDGQLRDNGPPTSYDPSHQPDLWFTAIGTATLIAIAGAVLWFKVTGTI